MKGQLIMSIYMNINVLYTYIKLYPRNLKISVILWFWLRRRRRLRTPTLVQAITLSQIHLSNSYSPIAIEVPDYKNPMIFVINRKNKMASGGHFV